MKAALEANHSMAAKAAEEPTQWVVAILSFTDAELGVYLRKKMVHWSYRGDGLQWWGALPPESGGSLQFEVLELQPIGLAAWTVIHLQKYGQAPSKPLGSCVSCQASGVPTWAASRKYGREEFCVKCWKVWVEARYRMNCLTHESDVKMKEL